ncbi:hypothetical protein QWZ00_01245 [Belliella kenyensis]|nr:hypothetical protein [Belliella kenyensis]MDN3601744.1 hypothetical protein [Belliella kenyensis]
MKKYISLLTFLLLFGACADDDKPGNCEYQREYDDFEAKLNLFIENTNSFNCNAVRQSAIRLLNKLDGCAGVQGVEEAVKQWRDLDCNISGG